MGIREWFFGPSITEEDIMQQVREVRRLEQLVEARERQIGRLHDVAVDLVSTWVPSELRDEEMAKINRWAKA